jgi:glutaredoxin 3
MAEEVIIYGKDSCPYTVAARDDYRDRGVAFRYINVKKDPQGLEAMLRATNGRRQVPVIVEAGRVTVGFGGT